MRLLLCVCLLVACSTAVKHQGFKASITRASESTLAGAFEAGGTPSCAELGPSRRLIHLVADGFDLTVVEEPPGGGRSAILVVGEERYVSDRAGASLHLVADDLGGRVIGSLNGTLVHESAGTLVDGRPAVVRDLDLELSFNLQPCL